MIMAVEQDWSMQRQDSERSISTHVLSCLALANFSAFCDDPLPKDTSGVCVWCICDVAIRLCLVSSK